MRKARLSIGDRIFVAVEYVARDAVPGDAAKGVSGGLVAPGATVEGTVTAAGDVAVVDCGADVLVRGDTLLGFGEGDTVRFTVAEEGKAYLIPTR
jgi:hypothetical protein